MHPRFLEVIERLHPAYERLVACEPIVSIRLPTTSPREGVYLFSEDETPLYVGRTNRLRDRHHEHWRPYGKHNDSPFAFKIARLETHDLLSLKGLSRAKLEREPEFHAAFLTAKARVSAMHFRWVEESDPETQCLLEIYAAIALQTPFNDFDNH